MTNKGSPVNVVARILNEKLRKGIILALRDSCLLVEGTAKQLCPVDKGALRADIQHEVDENVLTGKVFNILKYAPHVEYACFFSENIKILCRSGWKKLRYVKIGEDVLTFNNGFKKVIDKPIYNVNTKIERITVKTENNNSLTTTSDHPFLVKTNKGYIWKKARDLQIDDVLIEVDL